MTHTSGLSNGLLTDLYQLTMAQAYHSAGAHGIRGVLPPLLP